VLPPTAERAVQTDGLLRHLCFRSRQVKVTLERATFGVEHFEERPDAALIVLPVRDAALTAAARESSN
jgi:hypothetical protein